MNRPEVYNALNHALLTELGEVINQIRKDLGVGGVILTAKPIDAREAFRIGLVNQVVSAEELILKAKEMAEAILKNGSTAIRLAMDLILRGMDMSLDNSLAFESALSALTIGSPEALQRLKAFLEKKT
ncbi:MAG: hypothetical protein JSV55_09275 [Deltaproteobacteria bacterium]|nr:MAG: hypothetical protein JSV55_09275 [Deltaproteobacteria bacterium]